MKAIPEKVFILEQGNYTEITYREFCKRKNENQSYNERYFIPIQYSLPAKHGLVEVSQEIYVVYTKAERKIKYIEVELKTERTLLNDDGTIKEVIPSREDSLDRLIEDCDRQFADYSVDVEDEALNSILHQELHKALLSLSEDEYDLIYSLYFEKQTEREYAKKLGIYHNAVHARK